MARTPYGYTLSEREWLAPFDEGLNASEPPPPVRTLPKVPRRGTRGAR